MRHRALAVAVVAAQLTLVLMNRVIVVAALAFGDPTALMAQQGRRVATAIEEQHDLIIGFQMLMHFLDQRLRQPDFQL